MSFLRGIDRCKLKDFVSKFEIINKQEKNYKKIMYY